LAAKVLTQFKQKLAALELQPAGGGCFEITLDGQLIYSKLKTGEFPDEDAIVAELSKLIKK
jgi:selenoprotein W-related protein